MACAPPGALSLANPWLVGTHPPQPLHLFRLSGISCLRFLYGFLLLIPVQLKVTSVEGGPPKPADTSNPFPRKSPLLSSVYPYLYSYHPYINHLS